MEEICELPTKKRKIDESTSEKENDEKEENSNTILKAKPLQIKSSSLARLRQAAKNCQILNQSSSKKTSSKDNGIALAKSESRDQNQNNDKEADVEHKVDDSDSANFEGRDVIISSTGSSPAHSPKPEDFTVLSTPPKQPKLLQNQFIGKPDVSKNLNGQFEESNASDELDNKMVSTHKNESCQVKENEMNEPEVVEIDIDKTEEEIQTTVGEESQTAEITAVKPKIDLNSLELKKVLKAMIDEKFKQVEELYSTQGQENELYERITRLEEENKCLKEYAGKLEKAVKLLINNQRNKKDRLNQCVQTDNMVLRPNSAPSKATTPSISQPYLQPNLVNKTGSSAAVISKLTSTQAPIPGHSVRPAALPQQRATHQQQQVLAPSYSSQGQTFPVSQYAQKPSQPPNVQNIRPSVQQGSVAVPLHSPITVTVRPQTPPQTNKPNIILSPPYPTQVQKSSYLPSTRPPQPVQQLQPFVPNIGNRPPPVVLHHAPTVQSVSNVVPRTAAPQKAGPHGMQQFSNSVGMSSPPNSRPVAIPPTSVRPLQVPVANSVLANPPRPIQNANSPLSNKQSTTQTMTVMSPRQQGVSPNVAQPANNNFQSRDQPPRPIVSIAVVSNGIVLSWNMQNTQNSPRIVRYQLFALQDMGANNPPSQWKKIGVVNALPLPMACTLTQFMPGNKYHFTVRAQDEQGRCGLLSEPCTITLT